jgi:hypothetical protein
MSADLTNIVINRGAGYLRRYFAEAGVKTFTGRWFETLAGGGDREDTRDRVTGDDLIAVEMLSVEIPHAARRDLLDGPLGAQVNAHLARIPAEVGIEDPSAADLLSDGNDADQAHVAMRGSRRLGYVIAGKVLARKRPRLIPVYDARIRCQFGRPARFWLSLHRRFSGDGGALRSALIEARAEAGVAELTSVLRALDVILWMHHDEAHGKCLDTKSCGGFDTVSLALP